MSSTRFHSRMLQGAMAWSLALGSAWATPPTIPQDRQVEAGELKMAMFDLVRTVERAAFLDSKASEEVWRSDLEVFRRWSPRNKAKFVEAVRQVRAASDAALANGTRVLAAQAPHLTRTMGSTAFYPNYPNPSTSADYLIINALGFVQNPWERPHGTAYEYYVVAMDTAREELEILMLACTVAGCDPTGFICAPVCGGVSGTQALYLAASIPLRAARAYEGAIDSAEIEAAYRNAVLTLGDLSSHDERVMSKLNQQAGDVNALTAALGALNARVGTHDQDMKALIAESLRVLVANQAEIIKLLKTPEGRRPGWGKDGY